LLYTKDYIAKALKGNYYYGTSVELNAVENLLASIIQAMMAVCASIIWLLAKIPVLTDLPELFVRNYSRGAAGFFL